MEEKINIIRHNNQRRDVRRRSSDNGTNNRHHCVRRRFSSDSDSNDHQERRNIDISRLHRVRRRLNFDDGDNDNPQERENINNHFLEERRIQLEEAMKKWDFDFLRGRPVENPVRYEWVQLDEQGNEILNLR
ncbi:PREDICTED: uncharacterized protein LOC108765100 [Trachymyrmex cornetzi]|uniref:Cyclin-dependent kinase inhibitor domain-containing protein n=1 Tax=Trachymyrmex cornetzi TaxID=471704 RepID=A0A195DR91_9HYME|nr:PREDICTED: uncharacterized protein LOC108765100 [Trachymyrmex cornetzi]XP_018369147.1 PREDICTED: uncharacterized protein LOC108765100 [Trachymyrmex cornetzi]XP_018369148.1 PREDICTED: uncharacterized protein LOC108765100 [Trachymyrmex cornetzi]XP_018369149.1 PREDICTED: uncharacterized protein LOC108765100 [Trachymyrmex cornetzi]KYN15430.1 hypothetical protein ALC57_12479 [Trachymyrmex cornetzi]